MSVLLVGFVKINFLESNIIWVANGVLLAYLLLAPRRHWPHYIITGFLALITGSALIHEPWQSNLLYNTLDMIEVLTGAFLLRPKSKMLARFTDGIYMLRFIGFAVLAGPLVAGSILALISAILWKASPAAVLIDWMKADSLGIAAATPACVAIFQARFRLNLNLRRNWIYPVILIAVTVGVFAQTRVPVLFLVYPALVLVLLRLGLGWAASATLFVAFAGSWFTLRGKGPFVLATSISHQQQLILLQIFIASAMLMLYSISAILESERVTKLRLQKMAALHTLVTENSRDAIVIAGFHGRLNYISPSIRNLGGWNADEVIRMQPTELVHPDDKETIEELLRQLQESINSAVIELRMRTRKGDYIWVECSFCVYRDPVTGKRAGTLNLVRNINKRKLAERELQVAYDALEAMTVVDALTSVANRRRFDAYLSAEWRREMREIKPLSLLMLDADLFKSYNDAYGHLRGDSCLKQIAEACMDVVSRPGDLVARYGGEEFAIILPETDNRGAMQVAREICDALRSRKLKHESNPAGFVTISIGCATMTPQRGRHATDLIGIADNALYLAKRGGRNQVCNANEMEAAETIPPCEAAAAAAMGSKT